MQPSVLLELPRRDAGYGKLEMCPLGHDERGAAVLLLLEGTLAANDLKAIGQAISRGAQVDGGSCNASAVAAAARAIERRAGLVVIVVGDGAANGDALFGATTNATEGRNCRRLVVRVARRAATAKVGKGVTPASTLLRELGLLDVIAGVGVDPRDFG